MTLAYPRDSGAVLDLGCFDPAGFRGWSGGARDSFVVAERAATPGYLAGPVAAGLWQVAIGLHALPVPGVPFSVTAEPLSAGSSSLRGQLDSWLAAPDSPPVPGSRPARRSLPAEAGLTWLAGDLHAHTYHSDGVMSVAELAAHAVERGLDFVAVTDHNTVSHHAALGPASARYGVTLLPGQEVTTELGHAGVLGDTGWVDFREPAWSWLDLSWTTPLSWWQAWDPSAIPVGGSDWHRPGSDAPLGTPTTWVSCADESVPGVLEGLRAGRVAISASRDGAVLLRESDSFVAVGAGGLLLAGPAGPYKRIFGDLVRLPGAPGYHRLMTPAGATVALTP